MSNVIHFREYMNGRIDMLDGSARCISSPQYKGNLEMWTNGMRPSYLHPLPRWWQMILEPYVERNS